MLGRELKKIEKGYPFLFPLPIHSVARIHAFLIDCNIITPDEKAKVFGAKPTFIHDMRNILLGIYSRSTPGSSGHQDCWVSIRSLDVRVGPPQPHARALRRWPFSGSLRQRRGDARSGARRSPAERGLRGQSAVWLQQSSLASLRRLRQLYAKSSAADREALEHVGIKLSASASRHAAIAAIVASPVLDRRDRKSVEDRIKRRGFDARNGAQHDHLQGPVAVQAGATRRHSESVVGVLHPKRRGATRCGSNTKPVRCATSSTRLPVPGRENVSGTMHEPGASCPAPPAFSMRPQQCC